MQPTIIISVVSVIISAISVICAIYFSHKNRKVSDLKDLEQKVAERTAERTETNLKLNEITRNTQEIRYDVTSLKKDVQRTGEKIIELDASIRSAHHRIDGIEDRLNVQNLGKE